MALQILAALQALALQITKETLHNPLVCANGAAAAQVPGTALSPSLPCLSRNQLFLQLLRSAQSVCQQRLAA